MWHITIWANAHIRWRLALWRGVLFTDESWFSLYRADGRQQTLTGFQTPPNTVKLHILDWPFIVASLRHTCAIIMLSNQHLDMIHLWGGWLSQLTNTDLHRFVNKSVAFIILLSVYYGIQYINKNHVKLYTFHDMSVVSSFVCHCRVNLIKPLKNKSMFHP